PKRKQLSLREELLSHVCDRIDYYKEIGYDTDSSIGKALDDMGEDETVKADIRNRFEELHFERTWWSVVAASVILVMNWFCWPLGLWVTSADFNDEPTVFTAFVSFMMIFVMLFGVVFARIKKYRKMLIGIGVANMIVAGCFLVCFYPQSAFYVLDINTICLLDRFTPLYMNDIFQYYVGGFFYWGCIAFLALCSVYCFALSVLIKKGRAKTVKNGKIKTVVFVAGYFAVAVFSCAIYPWSEAYERDYPMWFSGYINGITEKADELYEEIDLLDDYSATADCLKKNGWMTVEAYEKSLGKVTAKQFRGELRRFSFAEDYEVWFSPSELGKDGRGNGFIAVRKNADNKITGKSVGNLETEMCGSEYGFGYYYISDERDAILELVAAFDELKKGDREEDVFAIFGSDIGVVFQYGEIYTKSASIENGVTKTYYRVYSYGTLYPDEKSWYDRVRDRYFEFTFENGLLTNGKMHWDDYPDGYEYRSVK
ncbi:MAG: DMT family transporter, partial [Clostridia bacterium]|nr:DMT family transporter [Clostridia bacterium]